MWSTVEKCLVSLLPILVENTEKTYLKLDLLDWYIFFVLPALNFVDILPTYNSPRFNLSVIFSIALLLSKSGKISFCNSLLISDIVLFFAVKISNALCWPISRNIFSLLACMLHHKSALDNFSSRMFPQDFCTTKVWRNISHNEKSTSS